MGLGGLYVKLSAQVLGVSHTWRRCVVKHDGGRAQNVQYMLGSHFAWLACLRASFRGYKNQVTPEAHGALNIGALRCLLSVPLVIDYYQRVSQQFVVAIIITLRIVESWPI